MKPKRCTSLWPFTGPIPSGNRRRCTLEAGHTGNHTIIPPSGMDYAPDDEPGIEPPKPEETIQELRDQKMALLLIVDDCHRIMEERADKIDELQDTNRDLHIKLHDLKLEMGEEIHALKVCATDTEYAWHALAEAAKELMEAEGVGGTFDGGRVREARARLKELVEEP